MKRFRLTKTFWLIAAWFLFATAVAGSVNRVEATLIDSFNDASQSVTADSSTNPDSDSASGSSPIGGTRDLIARRNSGSGAFTADVDSSNPGLFTHNAAINVEGTSELVWDGDLDPSTVDTDGLGGIDLIALGEDAFEIGIVSADLSATVTFTAWNDSTGATSTATKTLPGGISSATSEIVQFSEFTDPTVFSNLGAFRMVVDGPVNMDLALDFIQSIDTTPPVPEPSSLALLGIGTVSIWSFRRRSRKRKKSQSS